MAHHSFPNSRIYTGHVMPVLLDCNFIVDSTNGNGLGIRSLKGPYVQNVFMHTSSTPGAGSSNPASPGIVVTNPNPASGTIVVQLQDAYNRSLTGGYSIISPIGSSVAVDATNLTAGVAYVITVLGTTTQADWIALGVPSGLVNSAGTGLPAVGTSFIAAATGAGSGSGMVAPTAAAGSNTFTIETVGDPNQSMAPATVSSQGFGAQFILQCRNATASTGTSEIATPADGTVISLSFLLSNSSILIAGE